jgi:protein-L-isoaspartate(D-aspartate) O-methyltransferase
LGLVHGGLSVFYMWGDALVPSYTPKNNDELIDIVSNRRNYLGIEAFDSRVMEAMRRLDRASFIPGDAEADVYEDEPVKIGLNQTCSQPSMVAAMATLLELHPGQRVLEIGTGSGYSAAVASMLIVPGGRIYSIEIIEELHEMASKNLEALDFLPDNIELIAGDGSEGLPGQGPYDRIYYTAGAGKYFDEKPLLEQLSLGGLMLYPEAFGSMFLLRKSPAGIQRREMKGVGFVYLRGKNSGYD